MVLKEYRTKTSSGERMDVSKIVDEYQNKFQVPKFMIIRWLNLKTEKSLFTKPQEQSDVSSKVNSSSMSYVTKSDSRENYAYLNKTTKLPNLCSEQGKYKNSSFIKSTS